MYIESVPNRSSPPAILLRESFRDSGRVKKRTLANLSKLPDDAINALRRILRGERLVSPNDAFTCLRSLPHGHVAAVLATVRKLGNLLKHVWVGAEPVRCLRSRETASR